MQVPTGDHFSVCNCKSVLKAKKKSISVLQIYDKILFSVEAYFQVF